MNFIVVFHCRARVLRAMHTLRDAPAACSSPALTMIITFHPFRYFVNELATGAN
jgi:hypothetical protein